MVQSDVERIGILETKVEDHGRRIQNQEEISQQLRENNALLRQQMEDGREKDKRFSEVMDKINVNLTKLNSRFDHVEKRVDILEEMRQGNLIDVGQLWKTIIFKVTPTVIATIVGTWLLIQFGLNK